MRARVAKAKGRRGRAVVLLSGGLDSATAMAMAQAAGYECHALTVAYGQRHVAELSAARKLARRANVAQQVIGVNAGVFGGSALTDGRIAVPERPTRGIPVTYVPARNTMFLALALGWAEVLEARDIFIGVNAVDYSGYPDCRPAFIRSFEKLAALATRAGALGARFRVHAPLIRLSKAQIVRRAQALGVDLASTVSCYQADRNGRACGRCDSCRLRRAGFEAAGVTDPTRYTRSQRGQ